MPVSIQTIIQNLKSLDHHRTIPVWYRSGRVVNTHFSFQAPATPQQLQRLADLNLPADYLMLLQFANGFKLFAWDDPTIWAGEVCTIDEALDLFDATVKFNGDRSRFPFFYIQDKGAVSFELLQPNTLIFPYGGVWKHGLAEFLNVYIASVGTYPFPD